MVLVSIETHTAAIVAVLNAGSPNANAYTLDALKKLAALPDAYTEVTVSHRFGAPNRNVASTGRTGYRIATRVVAKREVNAQRLRDRVDTALRSQRVAAISTTPVQFETEDPIGDDDGWFSGLTTWTYST